MFVNQNCFTPRDNLQIQVVEKNVLSIYSVEYTVITVSMSMIYSVE